MAASYSCCTRSLRLLGLHLTDKALLPSKLPTYVPGYLRHNSNTAAVTRPKRNCYTRTYPTLLVFPDGSTINIRYKEPRQIIKLPLDFSKLSEVEKKVVLSNRKPKEKIDVVEEFDATFDANEYAKYWKK